MTLTEKEKMVLKSIMAESNFNMCEIDITKSWNEQKLESDTFWAFADVKDYGCGMNKAQVRGIFGSLVKKGLINIYDEDDGFFKVYWLTINEENFNKIKECLN